MALYLGVDIGTQGAKALVYDSKARKIISRGSSPYAIIESKVPGRAEQAPSTWVEGGISAIQQALASVDRQQVRAIAVSGQQHGLVALDAHGQVLRNAKLWCDTESSAEAAELSRALGTTIVPSFTATKLLWLKRNEPQLFERLAHVLLPHDYLNFWLTGRYAMEAGDASGTALLNTSSRSWDRAVMDLIDPRLHACMPKLLGPDEAVGTLLPGIAHQLGLGADVLVGPGSGDNACSALGSGVAQAGQLVVSLGTSGTIFGKSAVPIIDTSGAVCPFCDATGAWLPLVCTLNCTRPAEEVREAFGLDHETITALAEQEPPGCDGVSMLPFLQGERTPNWPGASGALLGLRPGSMRPGLLYRAALEGATFSLLGGLRKMTSLGLQPREVRLVGGGSKNRLWRQVVADAFQLPISLPLEPESAAFGAALQAAAVHQGVPVADFVQQHQPPMAEEMVQPKSASIQAYEQAFRRHVAYGEALFA